MDFSICTADCCIEHFQMRIGFFFKEFFILVENPEEFAQATGNCAKYLCCQILMGILLLTNCFSRLFVRVVELHQNVFVYQKIECSFVLHSFSIDLYIFLCDLLISVYL